MSFNANDLVMCSAMHCILCHQSTKLLYTKHDTQRGELRYYYCNTPNSCGLIFLDPDQRITAAEERSRYELHNNNAHDPRYRLFLKRLADPVIDLAFRDAQALDFGCGPEAVMSLIFAEQEITMQSYDPFFFPEAALLEKQYDIITASEVLEHVRDPATTVQQLKDLLCPGGYLGVMTETSTHPRNFADWWYHSDTTHVCFYSSTTFHWIAQRYHMEIVNEKKNVCILKTF